MARTKSKRNTKIVDKVMDRIGETLISLYFRWQDEREYEDFADYAREVKSFFHAIPDAKFVKMTKRPFAVYWTCRSDGLLRMTKATATCVETFVYELA